MFHRVATLCPERAEIITESFKRSEGQSIVIRRALALADILEKMTIYIEPDMLIVGNRASANFAAPVFPEYSFNWVIDELDEFDKRSGDSFRVSESTKARLRTLQDYWQGKPIRMKCLPTYRKLTVWRKNRACCTVAASACPATAISFRTTISYWKLAMAVCAISPNSTRKMTTT